MSKIKLEAPFKAFRGKICKHSDIIYKKMKQTQYTSQICNQKRLSRTEKHPVSVSRSKCGARVQKYPVFEH